MLRSARPTGEPAVLPRSLWAATAVDAPAVEPLRADSQVDVAIVGGGILGLSTALHLAERSVRVLLVEGAHIGWGASGRSTGQLMPGLKNDPDEVERQLGPEAGGRLVQWAGDAPARVLELIARHGIACEPVRAGRIQAAHSPQALEAIERRAAQWRARGVPVQVLGREELRARTGSGLFSGGWLDPRGGSVQPLSYARGLARAALRAGARLHAPTRAVGLQRWGGGWRLQTDGGTVSARTVVVATNAYSGPLLPALRRSVVPVRTTLAASRPLPAALLARILPGREVLSDTRRLPASVRLSPDGRLIVGGRDATAGAEHPRQARYVREAAQQLFPDIDPPEWEYVWSGCMAMTKDALPHLYEPEPGLLAGVGCNGRGIAVATGMGLTIAQHVLGRPASEAEVPVSRFDPYLLHAFRHAGVALATRWMRHRDGKAAA
ncbi:MAG TPA: FAD-dependent oxidoreductase [Ramlibacter sp.]|uniref:NAD(P)/FAD-dependent oxidoreductase n=1 Tax=Ramlibacter sp. TaxID=1917967 RepID=UPI002D697A0E|nr:FAD-dependent oxidoreductase [Ramlibacter sp.]HZY18503.1 FAD-dependent oxidoreductase [Ramlibacter sp.]